MKRSIYHYSLLKFVHDVSTGEFMTVGVLVYSAQEKFFDFKFRQFLGKASDIYPGVKARDFSTLIKGIATHATEVRDQYNGLNIVDSKQTTAEDFMRKILPTDDSALQWTDVQVGTSQNLPETVSHLYDRYAAKYDRNHFHQGTTDADISRSFRKELEKRSLSKYFQEKTIEGQSDDLKFSFAWKNGVWHCFDPVSFDLTRPEAIREKAHKCAGEIVAIRDSSEQFKVYLLVSEPQEAILQQAYSRALGILENIPVNKEIITEKDQQTLLDRLADQIQRHEQTQSPMRFS
jgi:hypothetical protein